MSFLDIGIRYLSKASKPPAMGPKRWFANTIIRMVNEGAITDDAKYVTSEDYDAMMVASETVAQQMAMNHFRAGKAWGYLIGSAFTVGAFFLLAVYHFVLQ